MRDVEELEQLKRAGAALLSVAPSSHNRPCLFFIRGRLLQAARESKTKIEERSEFKLSREKRTEKEREQHALEKRPGHSFAIADPDRLHYALYKVDASSSVKWVKVL